MLLNKLHCQKRVNLIVFSLKFRSSDEDYPPLLTRHDLYHGASDSCSYSSQTGGKGGFR